MRHMNKMLQEQEQNEEIDMTPMLDVVFIFYRAVYMLYFAACFRCSNVVAFSCIASADPSFWLRRLVCWCVNKIDISNYPIGLWYNSSVQCKVAFHI